MAGVTLRNVNKIYPNGFHAVHDQSLDIQDGEFMVFVGPSGCAKSTTLNMIAGLEEISTGEISIGDKVVNDLSPRDRDIAMVFQSYALYPHMTVYDNMAFALKLKKMPKSEIDKLVREAAEILAIADLLPRKPKMLSGGQRQRVALGRAIVRNPKVFLFDEPLSNLDAKLRVHMRVELAKLHQRLKTTMIYVTHDQVEAMTMGDRITVMKLGVIQQVDIPVNLYNKPINKFVATFIGSPSMNMTKVRLEKEGETVMAVASDGTKFVCPPERAEKVKEHVGKELWLGIRPEFIYFSGAREGEKDNHHSFAIDVVEQMGNEIFVYFSVGAETYVARMDPSTPARDGEKLKLWFDMNRCHMFDVETEQNLTI